MKSNLCVVFTMATALSLAACDGKPEKSDPVGQVIASVDGMEITQRDLVAEMDMIGPAEENPERAREAALQQIVVRKMLAKEARTRELDDNPDFGLLRQRAEETVLQTLLQRDLTRNLPDPTKEDARNYVASHPDLFRQRKLFAVEQVRMDHPADTAFLKKLKSLKTLDEVQALAAREGIKYHRGKGTLDAMQAPPELVKQIVALPPGEVFILPAGEATLVNLIRETRTSPVSEDAAQKVALNYLKQKAISQTLKNQLAEIVKKNKDRVRYQSGYGPKVVEASRDIGSSGG